LTAHQDGLPEHQFGLTAHRAPLPTSENSEGDSGERYDASVDTTPPIWRRWLFALASGFLLIPSCYFGTQLIDRGRKVLGRAVVVIGFVIFSAALLLFYLTGFEWSWGWLL
jgi:hypothetical protein